MQNKPISINKIIMFVVFISAALITSLFIYHASHQNKNLLLSEDEGLLFPVARDIQPLNLKTSEDKNFSLADFKNHWSLVFFGFTHCSNICPTTLDMLNRVYETLKVDYPTLQVVFISLDPKRDDMARLGTYTHTYNKDFIGASGASEDLGKIQAQFGIYSSRDEKSSEENYQLMHTPSIMLINPEAKWAGIFKFGMSADKFAEAFKKSVNQVG